LRRSAATQRDGTAERAGTSGYGQESEGWKPVRPDPPERAAPKDVAVLREEVFEQIKGERTNASEARYREPK
jgi:hypothetical protein